MKLDDQTLKKAFAESAPSREPHGACAAPERILNAVAGKLSPSESRALLRHSLRCEGCGAAWRIALQMVRESPEKEKSYSWLLQFFRWDWQPLALVAAAGLLVIIGLSVSLRLRGAPSMAALRLDVSVLQAAGGLRGGEAKPGDRLSLVADVGNSRYAELRVFREERQLIFRCPPVSSSCHRKTAHLEAQAPLPSVGRYQALLAVSEHPLPAPAGSFAEDSAALLNSGAKLQVSAPIQVW